MRFLLSFLLALPLLANVTVSDTIYRNGAVFAGSVTATDASGTVTTAAIAGGVLSQSLAPGTYIVNYVQSARSLCTEKWIVPAGTGALSIPQVRGSSGACSEFKSVGSVPGLVKAAAVATPAGSSGAVQFNNAGTLGGAAIHATAAAEVQGVELLTNGNFAQGLTGWTQNNALSCGGTWSIVSGHLHHVPGTAGCHDYVQQTPGVSQGDAYQLNATVTSQSAGHVVLNLGDQCNSDCTSNLTVGSNSYSTVAGYDSGPTAIQVDASSDSDATISLVGFRHPLPYLYAGVSTNVSWGPGTLASNTEGFSNIAIGDFALYSNIDASSNIALGSHALFANTTGFYNFALGQAALAANTVGVANVAVSAFALNANTEGAYNVASGYSSLFTNTTGSYNTAVGPYALANNTTGDDNVSIGHVSLYRNSTGSYNAVVGCGAMRESTTGSSNVALLTPSVSDACTSESGFSGSQKNANESILIGPMDVAGINSNSGSALANVIAIGGTATQSNQTVIGNSNTVETVIGGGVLRENLHTPASSSEACTAGQFSDDASFHYVCTAANTWKRVALSSF